MSYPERGVSVPPICPQHCEGPPITDLQRAPFHAAVHTTDTRPEPIVEAYAAFIVGDPEEDNASSRVETGFITEAMGSPLARRILDFAGSTAVTSEVIYPRSSAVAERLRQLLCGRVAICHGVVKGECWALGETGFREALDQTLPPVQNIAKAS